MKIEIDRLPTLSAPELRALLVANDSVLGHIEAKLNDCDRIRLCGGYVDQVDLGRLRKAKRFRSWLRNRVVNLLEKAS